MRGLDAWITAEGKCSYCGRPYCETCDDANDESEAIVAIEAVENATTTDELDAIRRRNRDLPAFEVAMVENAIAERTEQIERAEETEAVRRDEYARDCAEDSAIERGLDHWRGI